MSAAAFAAKKESALSKAKMFARQATKPQAASKRKADLTIQTSLSNGLTGVSERSPRSRPSKELERIASIGSLTTLVSNVAHHQRDDSGGKQHKHHISFRTRKDVPHSNGMLSSSASNSKLVSDQGSLYSFHPSSPGVQSVEFRSLGSKEEREQILEGSWSLLLARLTPLFAGESLRIPVEDLNSLVTLHLQAFIQKGGTSREVLAEFMDLLKRGMHSYEVSLRHCDDGSFVQRLVELWMTFFSSVLPYMEAVFHPLQLEFHGRGRVLPAADAQTYWKGLFEKEDNLKVRRFTLMSFRDNVVVPVADRLEGKQYALEFAKIQNKTKQKC